MIKGIDRAIVMKEQDRMLMVLDLALVVAEFVGENADRIMPS